MPLTEADTCRKFVVPKLQEAGWDDAPHAIKEQRTFTDGPRGFFIGWVLAGLLLPMWAVEAAPALTDREIAERLARLEEGLNGVRTELGLLRADMGQLRADMNEQNRQLREDMNLQFTYQFRLTLALLGAFTVLVASTISFALWDRRTMMRPLAQEF